MKAGKRTAKGSVSYLDDDEDDEDDEGDEGDEDDEDDDDKMET